MNLSKGGSAAGIAPANGANGLCVVHASPRANGNGAAICAAVASHLAKRGLSARIVHLDPERIHPCTACGSCARTPGRCVCDALPGDMARQVLDSITSAPALLIAAPVWFYGLPSHLKALIDRSQVFWEQKPRGSCRGLPQPPRPAWNILTAGRLEGQRLFEAGGLILRCFERQMGFVPQGELTLRGLDLPGDFSGSADAQTRLENWSLGLRWE